MAPLDDVMEHIARVEFVRVIVGAEHRAVRAERHVVGVAEPAREDRQPGAVRPRAEDGPRIGMGGRAVVRRGTDGHVKIAPGIEGDPVVLVQAVGRLGPRQPGDDVRVIVVLAVPVEVRQPRHGPGVLLDDPAPHRAAVLARAGDVEVLPVEGDPVRAVQGTRHGHLLPSPRAGRAVQPHDDPILIGQAGVPGDVQPPLRPDRQAGRREGQPGVFLDPEAARRRRLGPRPRGGEVLGDGQIGADDVLQRDQGQEGHGAGLQDQADAPLPAVRGAADGQGGEQAAERPGPHRRHLGAVEPQGAGQRVPEAVADRQRGRRRGDPGRQQREGDADAHPAPPAAARGQDDRRQARRHRVGDQEVTQVFSSQGIGRPPARLPRGPPRRPGALRRPTCPRPAGAAAGAPGPQ